jgi:hypothetical protein
LIYKGLKYHQAMSKRAADLKSSSADAPKGERKVFTGIKRPDVKVLKPGTVDPTETMRRLRGR